MKKRSCRRTPEEDAMHARAVALRKMTDEQLCRYVDEQAATQTAEPAEIDPLPIRREAVRDFLAGLRRRTAGGLRVSEPTIKKLATMAYEMGLLEAADA